MSDRRQQDHQPQANVPAHVQPQRTFPRNPETGRHMPPWPPQYQQQQPPQGYYPPQQYAPPRKRRRVFLWVFLAVQALFLIWIIAGVASHPAGPTAVQQAAQQCAGNGWYPLFKSQADCDQHFAVALNDAGNVGKGIGVVVIVVIWMIVDFFLGLGYGIYRLASRR
jgi:hypothetical protein